MTLREALYRVEQPRRGGAAAAGRHAHGAAAGLDAGVPDQPDVPSLALGSGLVSPLELTAAYAIFPNGGDAVRPSGILRVLDAGRRRRVRPSRSARHVSSPEVAFQMVTMLRDVVERGHGHGGPAVGRPDAGCRQDRDAPTTSRTPGSSAFHRHVVVGVWVGFDQPATIGRDAYGARVAVPIWAEFMRRAGRVVGSGTFDPPAGIEADELCRVSYVKPVDGCPRLYGVLQVIRCEAAAHCQIHHGTFSQRAERVIEKAVAGAVRSVWDKIWR